MKKKISIKQVEQVKTKREKRITCLVSEREDEIIENYLIKNKIKNKSTWMRETLLWFIYQQTEYNYPTLFNDHEMRR